jgi:hypothetical protein
MELIGNQLHWAILVLNKIAQVVLQSDWNILRLQKMFLKEEEKLISLCYIVTQVINCNHLKVRRRNQQSKIFEGLFRITTLHNMQM